MPNCDFYATEQDHLEILEWLFADNKVEIYEAYSKFEEPLNSFSTPDGVVASSEYGLANLALYLLGSGPRPIPTKIQLDPKACSGATYRFSLEGWGLIQLHLCSPINNELRNSHTNHNSEKRAAAWAQTIPELGTSTVWDFKSISSYSSRLNRRIKSMGIGAVGSRSILPGAADFLRHGGHVLPMGLCDPSWKNT